MGDGWQDIVAEIRKYFGGKLWDAELRTLPLLKRCGVWGLRVVTVVVRDFGKDHCMLRASALTYATMLAIVPLLAFAFAILKGLGVQNQLEPVIAENLAVGSEAERERANHPPARHAGQQRLGAGDVAQRVPGFAGAE